MFGRAQRCNITHKIMIRLNNFLYIFNLRQGTILIAVHQIALSSFILIILLVGISHVGDMLSMLQNDMEDDAERRGFYEVTYGDTTTFHEGDVVSTNNQRRFAKAQRLASLTVIFLYTSTILTSIYLMCCISLLHGAVQYKREYVIPWIIAACFGVVVLCIAAVLGNEYKCIVDLFGGPGGYHLGVLLIIITFGYAICAVCSFACEAGGGHCSRSAEERETEPGERLLLLDHAAHSSLLSAAQLSKLSQGTRTQFV